MLDKMSRRETEFNMGIPKATADSLNRQGRASQEKHGQGPASKSLDEYKIPGPKEEKLMERAGRESQDAPPSRKRINIDTDKSHSWPFLLYVRPTGMKFANT